ncbi:hypothetical protein MTR67_036517 [Solanum verrucosum]|uniref:Cytochrome P450 n=1 Tax=Solanum verrucosum TaxID=315347 RepID=A0AAF0UBX6_SOLVR|nr:cytochrome P450 71D11-like [Solanum verrucosum]WMV43132.1 hypothetical protein MTR67_036517 [Solanum verrucosum]
MESITIYFFASLLFIIVILKIRSSHAASSSSSKLPPGPWKLPIIGNLHQLAAGGPLVHKVLRDFSKKHGPIMHLQLGHVSTILVSTPETAKQVMQTHDIVFASRFQPLAAKIISYDSANIGFAPYGDYWRQMRKICVLDLLSTKRVQSFRSLREEEFSGLARFLASHAGSPVNLTQLLHSTMLAFTSRAAVGKKFKNQERFISILCELLKVGTGFNIADFYPSIKWLQHITGLRSKLEKLHHEVDRLLDEIIDDHIVVNNNTTSMHEDLVDVLLRVQNDGNYEITRKNIKAVILDMFAAGTDSSATTVDWTMAEMLKNPSVLEKAQEEVRRVFGEKGYVDESNFDQLKYLKAVIKETLRLHPPGPLLLPRMSREKCKIDGYEIQEKTQVLVNAWAIGRDSRYWEDAECFKAERFLDSSIDFNGNNFEYIPFGAGRRRCPGMSFGLANVEHPLALFLYHFDWKLPNGMKHEELDMSEVNLGVSVKREFDMHVIPIVTNPV